MSYSEGATNFFWMARDKPSALPFYRELQALTPLLMTWILIVISPVFDAILVFTPQALHFSSRSPRMNDILQPVYHATDIDTL
jgi:hypothetical protein